MCEKYQGYANYETWAVKLLIDNDEPTYNRWRSEARSLSSRETHVLADRLKVSHTDMLAVAFRRNAPQIVKDLAIAAMDSVDWFEIAEEIMSSTWEE